MPTLPSCAEQTATAIAAALRRQVFSDLRRRGLVVAMSGGIDSSVCAALAVRAVGTERVLGLALPEPESDPRSLELARCCAEALGIPLRVEEVGPALAALGCYQRRDQAVRELVPEYGPGWRMKLSLPRLDRARLNVTYLVVQPPAGQPRRVRLTAAAYRAIVAATNFKQRARKAMEYHHADRLHYAVVGTSNRLEHDQGFFVKGGDGLADVKPIAHLYKSQVRELGSHLGVPAEILLRTPTTDTYPLEQDQGEFYFALPVWTLDRLLASRNRGEPAEQAARLAGVTPRVAGLAYDDIARKREATRPLHAAPLLVEPVPEVSDPLEESD